MVANLIYAFESRRRDVRSRSEGMNHLFAVARARQGARASSGLTSP
jgi:hypothetical protein